MVILAVEQIGGIEVGSVPFGSVFALWSIKAEPNHLIMFGLGGFFHMLKKNLN